MKQDKQANLFRNYGDAILRGKPLPILLTLFVIFVGIPIVIRLLFGWSLIPWNTEGDGLLTFVGSAIAGVGAIFLGVVSLIQNKALQEQNEEFHQHNSRMLRLEELAFEPIPVLDLICIYEIDDSLGTRKQELIFQKVQTLPNLMAIGGIQCERTDGKEVGIVFELRNEAKYPIYAFETVITQIADNVTAVRKFNDALSTTVAPGREKFFSLTFDPSIIKRMIEENEKILIECIVKGETDTAITAQLIIMGFTDNNGKPLYYAEDSILK